MTRAVRAASAARAAAVVVVALALLPGSGCLDRGERDAATPEEAACPTGCPPPILHLSSCVESRFPLELDRVVFDVPPGYETAPSATSPQRAYVAASRCADAAVGNASLGPTSLVQVGVFVTAPDRGQGGNADIFGLELVTDQPALAGLFTAQGFNVRVGTLESSDLVALRHAEVTGDVTYRFDAQFVPVGDGPALASPPIPGSVAMHSQANWYQDDRTCFQYIGTSSYEFTADAGELARAMPAAGPLHGTSSLSFSCDLVLHFGDTTIASAG